MKRLFLFLARYFYALGSFLYLFTFGILQSKHRLYLESICRHFGLRTTARTRLPLMEIRALCPRPKAVEVLEPVGKDGNVTLFEILVINEILKTFRPMEIFEIGTFNGRTTANLAANSPAGAKIYSLDLPASQLSEARLKILDGEEAFIQKDEIGVFLQGSEYASKVTLHKGDSAGFDFSPFYGKMDLVFIDGSHSYDYVLNDTRIARQMLRAEGGMILWHDYGTWEDVTRALNGLFDDDRAYKDLKQVKGTSLAGLFLQQANRESAQALPGSNSTSL